MKSCIGAILVRKEKELRDFVEIGPCCLRWVAGDGTILLYKSRRTTTLGYSHEEYVGHNIAEFHIDEPAILHILTRLRNDEPVSQH